MNLQLYLGITVRTVQHVSGSLWAVSWKGAVLKSHTQSQPVRCVSEAPVSETALWESLLLFPGLGNTNKKGMESGF